MTTNPLLKMLQDIESKVRHTKEWAEDNRGIDVALTPDQRVGAEAVLAELRKCLTPDLEEVRRSVTALYSMCLDGRGLLPPEAEGAVAWEHTPFFSEAYLYVLLGKERARSVLNAVHTLIQATGLPVLEIQTLKSASYAETFKKAEAERLEWKRREDRSQARRSRKALEERFEGLRTTTENGRRLALPLGGFPEPYIGSATPTFTIEQSDESTGLFMEEGVPYSLILALAEALEARPMNFLGITSFRFSDAGPAVNLLKSTAQNILHDWAASGRLRRAQDPTYWDFPVE